jgi:hypothetical protein
MKKLNLTNAAPAKLSDDQRQFIRDQRAAGVRAFEVIESRSCVVIIPGRIVGGKVRAT